MSKFKKAPAPISTDSVQDFVSGANERTVSKPSTTAKTNSKAKTSFLLKLEQEDHELLRSIADVEERSMQWVLRKLTSAGIRKRAEEIGKSV
jgi:predicted type IV restriction endonuclease